MPVFNHDASRVHPPGGPDYGIIPETTEGRTIDDTSPATKQSYTVGFAMVAVSLGGSGETHAIVWVGTQRGKRGQGHARAALEAALADIDIDKKECLVTIQNYDPDLDEPRFVAFLEKHGFVLVSSGPSFLRRPAAAAPK
jgi:ribosomal protein S18 acetylase RimI-like enzyme